MLSCLQIRYILLRQKANIQAERSDNESSHCREMVETEQNEKANDG
jgi:hypothetical protein